MKLVNIPSVRPMQRTSTLPFAVRKADGLEQLGMRNAEDLAQFDRLLFDAARKPIQAKGRNKFVILELVRQLRLDYPEFSENASGST
jgi:hypothetical protein